MTLIKTISGIRGTIGGEIGDALTPIDVAKYALAFGKLIKERGGSKIVIGRDSRISGEMVKSIVSGNLLGLGIDVVDLGLATTPTVEMAVVMEKANAGIIITASHNPRQWNALKLLNEKGEFISEKDGQKVLEIAEDGNYDFVSVDKLGVLTQDDSYLEKHIQAILDLPLVDKEAVESKKFKVVVDGINSVGAIAVPALLRVMGVKEIFEIFSIADGKFQREAEPLPENLSALMQEVKFRKANLGIAVDPDVDRLVLIDENGEPIGEEYTLVLVADYILKNSKGNTVSNLSSTLALKDITLQNGGEYHAAAVGEVNVVEKMKEVKAVIGGEGNGGIIYPDLHYGRDALVGIALVLTYMAKSNKSLSALRATYPNYEIKKDKITLEAGVNIDAVLDKIASKYTQQPKITIDGLKILLDNSSWVHLRKSNTEPIVRIIAESNSKNISENIVKKFKSDILDAVK